MVATLRSKFSNTPFGVLVMLMSSSLPSAQSADEAIPADLLDPWEVLSQPTHHPMLKEVPMHEIQELPMRVLRDECELIELFIGDIGNDRSGCDNNYGGHGRASSTLCLIGRAALAGRSLALNVDLSTKLRLPSTRIH